MQIIGSLTSPFVRVVRITCEELGLPFELIETGSVKTISEEDHKLIDSNNPLMKVPILHDGDVSVVDSRIIINYLLQKDAPNAKPDFDRTMNIDKENFSTVIYGIADAAVLRFLVSMSTDVDPNAGYLGRSYVRMGKGLEYLNEQQSLGQSFGIPELQLISLLDWFKKRNVMDFTALTHLNEVHERFQNRESVVNTAIPANL